MGLISAVSNYLDALASKTNAKANEIKASKGLPLESLKDGERIITETKKHPNELDTRIKEIKFNGRVEWLLQEYRLGEWKTVNAKGNPTNSYFFMRAWFDRYPLGNEIY